MTVLCRHSPAPASRWQGSRRRVDAIGARPAALPWVRRWGAVDTPPRPPHKPALLALHVFMQRETAGECPERQRGRTVNPLAYAFVGSSPTSPTSLRGFGASAGQAKARPPKLLDRQSPSSGEGGRRGWAFVPFVRSALS